VTFALGPWHEVRSGVYVAVAQPESVNLGLIVGSQRSLLVDTGSSPDQGRALRESLARVTDKQLAAVVVTHWHFDHTVRTGCFRRPSTNCP
jgi:glyoxylase-like metal-dependent hydrolase (beta-lactamase superfamily II)